MRMVNGFWKKLFLVLFVFMLVSCGGEGESNNQTDGDSPIVLVDDEEILIKDFQARARFIRNQLIGQYLYYSQIGYDDGMATIEQQLGREIVGQNTIRVMIDGVIILREAGIRGIEITDEDIEAIFESFFGYDPETPVSPTGESYTYDKYLENRETFLDYLESEIDVTESDLEAIFRVEAYRIKLMDIIITDIEMGKEMVWARHILVEDEATALEVLVKFGSGEDFETLALEYSIGPSATEGGDLGWFDDATMVSEFSDAAFSLEIDEISEPVQTQFGWHNIQVLGRETKPLTPEAITEAKEAAFYNWLEEQRGKAVISYLVNLADYIPETPALPDDYQEP